MNHDGTQLYRACVCVCGCVGVSITCLRFEEHLKGILRGVDPELDPSTLPAVAQHHVSNVNMTTKGKGLKATLQVRVRVHVLLWSGMTMAWANKLVCVAAYCAYVNMYSATQLASRGAAWQRQARSGLSVSGTTVSMQGMNLTTPLLISGNAATANLSNEVQAIQKRIESLQGKACWNAHILTHATRSAAHGRPICCTHAVA